MTPDPCRIPTAAALRLDYAGLTGQTQVLRPATAAQSRIGSLGPVSRDRGWPSPRDCLVSRTRAAWQYQGVSSLSGLRPPPWRPRIRLSPASSGRCDGLTVVVSSTSTGFQRLAAHDSRCTAGPYGAGASLDAAGPTSGDAPAKRHPAMAKVIRRAFQRRFDRRPRSKTRRLMTGRVVPGAIRML